MFKYKIVNFGIKRFILTILIFVFLIFTLCFVLPERFLPRIIRPDFDNIKDFISFVEKISPSNVGWCLCSSVEEIIMVRGDGLKIAGSLYGTKDKTVRPGIVMLHGNTPVGRKLAVYKVLANRLSENGYIVLTMDYTGFGESDDPFTLGTIEALDKDKDVYTAIEFLKTLHNVDTSLIYIIGHSRGAAPAFSVGIKDSSVKGIVAIGPPRRVTERSNDPQDVNYFWKRAIYTRRKIYGKEFPDWYTKDLWLEGHLNSDMKKYINYFSQNLHKPLLLIDGELESEEDKAYLRNFFNEISEPKRYITLPNADHYCNTMTLFGIIFYDKNVITQTINEIDHWITESGK